MSQEFTPEQCRNFIDYERVQRSGRWNMLDPRARGATGMSKDEYFFVLENYLALQEAVKVKVKA